MHEDPVHKRQHSRRIHEPLQGLPFGEQPALRNVLLVSPSGTKMANASQPVQIPSSMNSASIGCQRALFHDVENQVQDGIEKGRDAQRRRRRISQFGQLALGKIILSGVIIIA
jgi:hypothetical protein